MWKKMATREEEKRKRESEDDSSDDSSEDDSSNDSSEDEQKGNTVRINFHLSKKLSIIWKKDFDSFQTHKDNFIPLNVKPFKVFM